jgi:hypothetical protein
VSCDPLDQGSAYYPLLPMNHVLLRFQMVPMGGEGAVKALFPSLLDSGLQGARESARSLPL